MRVYLKAYGKHHGLKMEGLLAEVLLHLKSRRALSTTLVLNATQTSLLAVMRARSAGRSLWRIKRRGWFVTGAAVVA